MREKGRCVYCGNTTIDEEGNDWLVCENCKREHPEYKTYAFSPFEMPARINDPYLNWLYENDD